MIKQIKLIKRYTHKNFTNRNVRNFLAISINGNRVFYKNNTAKHLGMFLDSKKCVLAVEKTFLAASIQWPYGIQLWNVLNKIQTSHNKILQNIVNVSW